MRIYFILVLLMVAANSLCAQPDKHLKTHHQGAAPYLTAMEVEGVYTLKFVGGGRQDKYYYCDSYISLTNKPYNGKTCKDTIRFYCEGEANYLEGRFVEKYGAPDNQISMFSNKLIKHKLKTGSYLDSIFCQGTYHMGQNHLQISYNFKGIVVLYTNFPEFVGRTPGLPGLEGSSGNKTCMGDRLDLGPHVMMLFKITDISLLSLSQEKEFNLQKHSLPYFILADYH